MRLRALGEANGRLGMGVVIRTKGSINTGQRRGKVKRVYQIATRLKDKEKIEEINDYSRIYKIV